jgi:hypothetical protein
MADSYDDEQAEEQPAAADNEEREAALQTLARHSVAIVRLVEPGHVHVRAGDINVNLGPADVGWLRAAASLLEGR